MGQVKYLYMTEVHILACILLFLQENATVAFDEHTLFLII